MPYTSQVLSSSKRHLPKWAFVDRDASVHPERDDK
jgi:hypothetical protein